MNKLCRTCLSGGRRLTPMTASHKQMFRWMNLKVKTDASICWECEGLLRRLTHFRTRVMKAQRTINLCHNKAKMAQNVNSLSGLSTRYSDSYDVTIDADDVTVQQPKIKVEPEEPTTSNEEEFTVELKIEPNTDSDNDNMLNENDNVLKHNDKMLNDNDKMLNNDDKMLNDDEMDPSLMIQPQVVFYDEEANNKYTKDDFYVVKTMTLEELELARKEDRNGARYKFCPYKCESCILGYYHEELLNKHIAERHSPTGAHVCNVCSQRFCSEDSLSCHHSAHFNGYQCLICGYNHHRFSQMDSHYQKVHKSSVNRCSPCLQYFPNYRMLKYHRETTHRELPTCDFCGNKYKTKAILKRHMLRHMQTEMHKCAHCPKTCRGAEALKEHQRKHEPRAEAEPRCEECDVTFKNAASYKNHLHFSLKHKGPEAMSRYTCKQCGKRFQNKPAVQRHMEAIHLSDTVCTICNKWFTREAKLKEHIKFVHEGAQKVKDKICTICGIGFSENRILVGHMRTHTGEKPYSCVHCGASFSQSGTLKAHIRVKHQTQ